MPADLAVAVTYFGKREPPKIRLCYHKYHPRSNPVRSPSQGKNTVDLAIAKKISLIYDSLTNLLYPV